MKNLLLLSILLLSSFITIKAQPYPGLECTRIDGPSGGFNNDHVTVIATVKNITQQAIAGNYHLGFYEGIYWYMYSNQINTTINPGESKVLSFRATIPSEDYIKIKGGNYSLRVYFTPSNQQNQTTRIYINKGILPFYLY